MPQDVFLCDHIFQFHHVVNPIRICSHQEGANVSLIPHHREPLLLASLALHREILKAYWVRECIFGLVLADPPNELVRGSIYRG